MGILALEATGSGTILVYKLRCHLSRAVRIRYVL
jgi:hypothetical protein